MEMTADVTHTNMARDTQQHVSTQTVNPKPPDSPTGATRSCPEKVDGLESCPGTQGMHHMHGSVNGPRRPAKVLEPLDLPPGSRRPWLDQLDGLEPCEHAGRVQASECQCERLENICKCVSNPRPTC